MSSRFEFHININEESIVMMDYQPEVDKYGEEKHDTYDLYSALVEAMRQFEDEKKDMRGEVLEDGKVISEVTYTASEDDYNVL
mgnify:CR=1 FL=1